MLIPLQEMAPGQASAIRNSVMDAVVAKASRELALPENKLVIRDIRPYRRFSRSVQITRL